MFEPQFMHVLCLYNYEKKMEIYFIWFLFSNFLEDISSFCASTGIPCFGFLVITALSFKDSMEPVACLLFWLYAMDSSDSSDATPADLLAASMAVKLFLIQLLAHIQALVELESGTLYNWTKITIFF